MVRPRTPIGTYSTIAVRRQPSGRYAARTRYRDWDGKSRHVQTTATTRPAAERELKKKLAERSLFHPGFTGMSADSAFPALVDYWLEDMELEDRLSRATRQLYERNMRTLVLPFFRTSRSARSAWPVATPSGTRSCPQSHGPRLTPAQTRPQPRRVHLGRDHGYPYRDPRLGETRHPRRPRPDGQLGQIVEVVLGTSARIGEVLAIRVADLDLDAPVAMVRIAGMIVSRKGEPTHRQDHPKTARSVRRVALPGFALRAVCARLRGLRFVGPGTLLFTTRVGTPHTTNNVRRQLRPRHRAATPRRRGP